MQPHNLTVKLFVLIGSILAICKPSFGQPLSLQKLEDKVYQLNNKFRYNESQSLLHPLLRDDNLSADYKYGVAILLSYTYKRVFDYQSTLKFLSIAQTFSDKTPAKHEYAAKIKSEQAFVYFDIHEYKKSDSLMSLLSKSDFKYIDLENKSKLVMQQGYLLFLGKQYTRADALYDKAIKWMNAASPCNLPMIYVKKMQLYNATNRMDLLKSALQKSTFYADSCKIIKYHLYAHEELLAIYVERNELSNIAATKKKLDSLNKIYARDEHISSLHNQRENILLKEKDLEIEQEQVSKNYLTYTSATLFAVALFLAGCIFFYRRRQLRMDTEFLRMKSELETFLSLSKIAQSSAATSEKEQMSRLSERQQEVLKCLARGMSNKIIADKLFISENTVKYHIKNIYQLLDIKDRKDFLANMKK